GLRVGSAGAGCGQGEAQRGTAGTRRVAGAGGSSGRRGGAPGGREGEPPDATRCRTVPALPVQLEREEDKGYVPERTICPRCKGNETEYRRGDGYYCRACDAQYEPYPRQEG